MSDKAFEKMMGQIAAEAQAEQVREVRDQNRRKLMGRIKTVFTGLLGAGVLAAGYYYRAPMQQFVSEKVLNKPQVGKINGATGEQLKGIQAASEKRDEALDAILSSSK